jgi:DNA-binding GntR family transcriptional regulator
MYQSTSAAEHSHEEHAAIVAALAARDEPRPCS